MPGQSLIVLSKYEDAINLFERRSAIYSDRPNSTEMRLTGLGDMTSLMRYGDQWRRHRRLLQDKLSERHIVEYNNIHLREVKLLLQKLADEKCFHLDSIRRFATAIPLEIGYGHRITSDDDIYLTIARDVSHALASAQVGTSLLDMLPFLQFIFPWIPGLSSFTETPRKWYPCARKLYNYPFQQALKRMAAGETKSCFVTDHVQRLEEQGLLDEEALLDIRDTAATLFLGGFDTTSASINTFVLAMLLFPEKQRRAQTELDQVIGSDRLPDFNDRRSLPYLECVLQEVLRWHPVARLGLPHRSVADDIYEGMFIPKDTVVVPNVLAMNRDETVYRDPDNFHPERFLPRPHGWGEKYISTAWGFGRRICPGRYLADAILWITFTNILVAFNITCITDGDGKDVVPAAAFTETLISEPKPFTCAMTPRSETMGSLIYDVTG